MSSEPSEPNTPVERDASTTPARGVPLRSDAEKLGEFAIRNMARRRAVPRPEDLADVIDAARTPADPSAEQHAAFGTVPLLTTAPVVVVVRAAPPVPPARAAAAPRRDWGRLFKRTEFLIAIVFVALAVTAAGARAVLSGSWQVDVPTAVQQMRAVGDVVASGERMAMLEHETYVTPDTIFLRGASAAGIADAKVQYAFADENHWILKVRYESARTVCVQMMTITDRREPSPECHAMSKQELGTP